MFRSIQTRLVAALLLCAVLLLPVSATASQFDGTHEGSARFEERAPLIESLWDRLVQIWLKAGGTLTPNGKK